MPIYEYECPECHQVEERIETVDEHVNDDKLRICRHCQGAIPLIPKFSAPNVVMGGSEGASRRSEMLQRRNLAYDRSDNGRAERRSVVERFNRRA